jgi:hypothetical protein
VGREEAVALELPPRAWLGLPVGVAGALEVGGAEALPAPPPPLTVALNTHWDTEGTAEGVGLGVAALGLGVWLPSALTLLLALATRLSVPW